MYLHTSTNIRDPEASRILAAWVPPVHDLRSQRVSLDRSRDKFSRVSTGGLCGHFGALSCLAIFNKHTMPYAPHVVLQLYFVQKQMH